MDRFANETQCMVKFKYEYWNKNSVNSNKCILLTKKLVVLTKCHLQQQSQYEINKIWHFDQNKSVDRAVYFDGIKLFHCL